jgi:type 1 glutamine amidotransferase
MFKRLSIAVLTALTLCCTTQAADKIKVLIVTGDDVNVHKWKEVAPATKDILTAAGKFDVKITENTKDLEKADDLKTYDVVFLALYNNSTPTLTDTAKKNLLDFVKGGKGIVVSHLASASFKEWDEFKKLCGRYWVMGTSGHVARGKFKVAIKDKENPIMKGLQDFEADDECYSKLQGDAPIQVLATSESEFSKKTEPMVFTTTYGQGRVFHETFGHDTKALDNAAIKTIIQRGTEWAATGKVQ